jgi:hypothetical protein
MCNILCLDNYTCIHDRWELKDSWWFGKVICWPPHTMYNFLVLMELNQEETPVSKIPVAGPFWYKLVSRQQSRQQKDMEIIRIKKKCCCMLHNKAHDMTSTYNTLIITIHRMVKEYLSARRLLEWKFWMHEATMRSLMMKPAKLGLDPLRFQILCSVLLRWLLCSPYLFKSSSALTPVVTTWTANLIHSSA